MPRCWPGWQPGSCCWRGQQRRRNSPEAAMLDSLLRILALTRKELLAVLKDPRSRVTLFLPPILQSLLFGYAATYDLNHVPYAVFDQDGGAGDHDLIARLDGSGVFEQVSRIYRTDDIPQLI